MDTKAYAIYTWLAEECPAAAPLTKREIDREKARKGTRRQFGKKRKKLPKWMKRPVGI